MAFLKTEIKWGLVFFLSLIGLISVVVLGRMTLAPEYELERKLQKEFLEIDLRIFNAMLDGEFLSKDEIKPIERKATEIEDLREKAQVIYDSIKVGEGIRRIGLGGDRPIGKNKEVVALRTKANNLEKNLIAEKREVAATKGERLKETESKQYWFTREKIMESLNKLHKKHFWYYQGFLGTFLDIAHGVFKLLAFFLFFLSVITGIIFFFGNSK
ncbi:MAG: hypothetical protein R3B95_08030 [Nitrospirales bacterium]|nr:hypothetical protein [Nitrospirales bacterium]